MAKVKEFTNKTAEAIQARSRRLSWVIVLIIFVVLFLIVRFVYGYLGFIPLGSVVTLMSIIAALSVATYLISRSTTDRALAAMEEYSRKIRALLATTRDIQDIGYSDILLESIIDVSVEMTRADGGSIILVEGDTLVFKIVRGVSADKLLGHTIPKGKGIVGWVVENSASLRVSDVRKDTRFSIVIDKVTGYSTISVLCVPMIIGGRTIGALELVHHEPDVFKFEDEEIMKHFASQAALAFDRARHDEDEKNYKIHLTNILVEAIEGVSKKHGHARRVARYTLLLADALGMTEEQKERLYRASMLLDIGFLKIRVDDVTNVSQYKAHAKYAFEMLTPIAFYQDVLPLILHHHERWDGSGYPVGLEGKSIPLESRVLSIAEAFDAMVSRSSYKNVDKVINPGVTPHIVPFSEAVEELRRNAGAQFDPELVDTFIKIVAEEDAC